MAKKKRSTKKKKVSYYKQPHDLSIRAWQTSLRKQFGEKQTYALENLGNHKVWSDFKVINPENKNTYRVAIRGTEVGDNFCSCYDFKTNTLGTCKHIEWTLHKLKNTHGNKQYFKKAIPPRHYSSVYLEYGKTRRLRLRIGTQCQEQLADLAKQYFDQDHILHPDAWLEFDQFLQQAREISPDFRCYPDALDFIIQKRADQSRAKIIEQYKKQPDQLDQLLKTKLFPYQKQGVAFAFKAGACLMADEMGLGKTIQAIATAELYKKELKIERVYIVCPTSLKYQWKAEIEKFTDTSVHVIEGPMHKRIPQYENSAFYKILTYNIVVRDRAYINKSNPDFIILDEAQRIKNWNTQIAYAVKRLQSPYRLALTGTPLENKIEDLYSIMQFIDQYKLGPLWQLLDRHRAIDEKGALRGYRHLDEINTNLQDVMIRRRKLNVRMQMPTRMDKNLLVPMTPKQRELHDSYKSDVAQLVSKWVRLGFLNERDRNRLMISMNSMRMSCDSTYILDQQTRHDTKISELFYILEEQLVEPKNKVVIFSQWERMTRLVAADLEKREIDFAYLHGGIPGNKRGALLDRFRKEEHCRVFLSTDAGGVGLNLQSASLVINLDLPWNPAVLEQRIGRIYRLGQENPVQVINLISEGTIEHQMVQRLKFKSSLAEAILDTGEDQVFMSEKKFKDFMESLQAVQLEGDIPQKQVEAQSDEDFEIIPDVAEPEVSSEPFSEDWWEEEHTAEPSEINQQSTNGQPEQEPRSQTGAKATDLVQTGMSFLTQLSQTLSDPAATEQLVQQITEKDEKSGQTYIKLPVESEQVVQNAMKLFSGLLSSLK